MVRQATLIQDVIEYRRMLVPVLREVMRPHKTLGCTNEDVLEWIIAQQIEDVYTLTIAGHDRHRSPCRELHETLRTALPWPLERLTRHFIKVPILYGDEILSLRLKRHDLYLFYDRDTRISLTL